MDSDSDNILTLVPILFCTNIFLKLKSNSSLIMNIVRMRFNLIIFFVIYNVHQYLYHVEYINYFTYKSEIAMKNVCQPSFLNIL